MRCNILECAEVGLLFMLMGIITLEKCDGNGRTRIQAAGAHSLVRSVSFRSAFLRGIMPERPNGNIMSSDKLIAHRTRCIIQLEIVIVSLFIYLLCEHTSEGRRSIVRRFWKSFLRTPSTYVIEKHNNIRDGY